MSPEFAHGRPHARQALAALVLVLALLVSVVGRADTSAGARSEGERVTSESGASQSCSSSETAWRPLLKEEFAASDAGHRALAEEWSAREAYDRVWTRAGPLLGAGGQAPPRMSFQGGFEQRPVLQAVMWVAPDEAGCRTIFVTVGQRRALGKLEGNWRSRAAALTRTLHETAHYFQSSEVLLDLEGRELGASRWARAHAPAILGTARKDRPVRFQEWRDRDQFGSNYGGDPQAFGWPTLDEGTFASHVA